MPTGIDTTGVQELTIIPDPSLTYLTSGVRRPVNLPLIPDSLEAAVSVAEGDLVYLRLPRQLMIDTTSSSTRCFTHSFYPGHIRLINGELCFVSAIQMPSYPPGYGLDHLSGTQLPLRGLDMNEFYKLKEV